ncbi:MAG: hypothetical protein C5B48_02125, partial [Candidatus Rokuibacteriota bacterium]
MSIHVERPPLHFLPATLCLGLAAANLHRASSPVLGVAALAFGLVAVPASGPRRFLLLLVALGLGGLWWGSLRLDRIDRSVLAPEVGRAGLFRVVVTGPARRGRFQLRVPAVAHHFESLRLDEPILLELPLGRAPPQGAVLQVLGVLRAPHGPEHGFDERLWLRRHGVHVVLHGDRFRTVGRRGGFGGFADRLHAWLRRSLARNARGERR